jgi:hypothetical protein
MRVVIVGLGKSGTTALVYAVHAAMPAGTQMLFEPHRYIVLQAADVVAKVLLHPRFPIEYGFYRQFDERVLLVRDPRDLLISKALYRMFNAKSILADPAKLERYLGLLRAKESNPRSVSLSEINRTFQAMVGPTLHSDEGIQRLLRGYVAFHEAFPDAFVYRYEAMVENDYGTLADYLDLPAEAMRPVIPPVLNRVVRTRRAGNWRHWFCDEDVAHYRPLLADYMERYGYGDDWTLADDPHIERDECSGYVERLVRERRGEAVPLPDRLQGPATRATSSQ